MVTVVRLSWIGSRLDCVREVGESDEGRWLARRVSERERERERERDRERHAGSPYIPSGEVRVA